MTKRNLLYGFVLMTLVHVTSVFGQNKPFPQQVSYAGCIKPNHVSQATLNASVATYYDYWKSQYLKNNLSSLPGGYYVKGDITGSAEGYKPLGSSEGQGYGMVITALMAGHDPNAKTIYDGLFKTARAYKSSQNSNLMGWVVADATSAQGHFDSATDGDMDIAYSLILAHYQWGSSGAINYLEEAKKMITNGLKASNVTNNNRLNLGDWDAKSAYNSRPSDWMLSHMRAFYDVTGDVTWLNVINNLYSVYNGFTASYSSTTGLITDFIVGNPAQPCPANYLDEYPETNTYSYNACRFPLRLVMDYALYGANNSKTASEKIVNWIKGKAGSPSSIKDGYQLNGSVTGTYATAVFVAPFIAAGVTNSANQSWVNNGWDWMKNAKEGYYSDSYNMLCMIFMSGNWWIPGGTTSTNQPPSVSITSPSNNAGFTAPASITINANASDADGSVSKVDFYNGSVLLGTDNSSPYSFSWNNVAAGTYTLTAVATDNSNASTTSAAITITVSNPVVQTPYGGQPWPIPGTIQAEDYDLGGQGVAYNETTTANQGGAYRTSEAVDVETCTDAGGGYDVGYIIAGEWLEYTVNVTNTGLYNLAIRVAAITSGKTFHMELDGTNITGTITVPNTSDWQNWQTVNVNNINLTAGQKVLRIAMDSPDFNLNYFSFTAATTVNQPPVINLTAPANNSSYNAPASVTISANASDADGSISKVDFYSGSTLLYSDNTSPYSYTWTSVSAGNYTITAKATDNLGATTTSTAANISVNATVNQAPTVSLTAPANNTSFNAPASISITATASDADGSVSKVDFYSGGVLLYSDNTSPYSYTWTNVSAGNYTITAKATDNLGATTTSGAANISVNAAVNQAPTVSLTAPANNASFNAPASIAITATAADADGSVSKVDFYSGSTLLYSDNSSPYSYTWSNVSVGNYTITAKATDNLGATTTSAAVNITVNTVTTDACAGIAQYVENNGYLAGSKVKNAGSQYQCKPWPYSGWCNGAAWAYAPGTGMYWSDAWILVGSCTARNSNEASVNESVITNAPNPFKQETVIQINQQDAGEASVKLYDQTGQLVQVLSEGYLTAGIHEFIVTGNGLKAGFYIVKYASNQGIISRKLVKSE